MERLVLLSDQELLAAYRAGSTRARELLFRKYSLLVERYIRAHVRDSEDVYNLRQEVLLKVLNGIRTTYRETGRLLPWVMTITVNVVNDYYRQRVKESEIILDEFPSSLMLSEDFSAEWDYLMRHERAYKILEQVCTDLSLEDRALIYAFFYENQSFRQMALSRGVSKSSCFKYLQRLLFRLRKMMMAAGVDESFLEE
ncbi:sigma-70 family RNA polymerase sigma factor [Phocaeicola sp.]|uniref:RNA polymerase sigma factor n=1 Tax=Phocaeicola sp. TaxID=2773926 RepID=UPI00283B5B1A|nr:sigma-70 family RNA polymerase sigma factor [Phocaeicola sp.]MDR3794127.1 sigma-70 family RNA polymerase sigma factor [Phocaeicola sp.]